MEQGFIAYIGSDLTDEDIKKLLAEVVCERVVQEDKPFEVRIIKSNSVIFGQVINNNDDLEYVLPYLYKDYLLTLCCKL